MGKGFKKFKKGAKKTFNFLADAGENVQESRNRNRPSSMIRGIGGNKKQKKTKKTRKPRPISGVPDKEKRVFNGETFVEELETNMKSDAKEQANRIRRAGFKARIKKRGPKAFAVFSGPRRKKEFKENVEAAEDFGDDLFGGGGFF